MSQAGNYADCEICEYKLERVEETSNNIQQLKVKIRKVVERRDAAIKMKYYDYGLECALWDELLAIC